MGSRRVVLRAGFAVIPHILEYFSYPIMVALVGLHTAPAHLRLEDAESDRDSFVQALDSFLVQNYMEQEFCTQSDKLRADLDKSFKPIKSYKIEGFKGLLVNKLASNLNQSLGYKVDRVANFRGIQYRILALPFFFWDRVFRVARLIHLKLKRYST